MELLGADVLCDEAIRNEFIVTVDNNMSLAQFISALFTEMVTHWSVNRDSLEMILMHTRSPTLA